MDPRAKQIKSEIEAVRRIMNEWNPIGFECPPDEYDCLVDQIVSSLHRGDTDEDLPVHHLRVHRPLRPARRRIGVVAHGQADRDVVEGATMIPSPRRLKVGGRIRFVSLPEEWGQS